MSWKTTLYDYVHHKNQMDMDYSVEPLLPFVADSHYLQTQVRRLARTAHSDQDRRFVPAKNETRLTLGQADERPGRVIADIKMRRTSVGTIGGVEHEEQRVESQRIQMDRVDGKWYIIHIEDLDMERTLPTLSPVIEESDEDHYVDNTSSGFSKLESQPYLNYDVLPYLEPASRKSPYNRGKAVEYAEMWWDQSNPEYIEFDEDCTNFISQCLFAGGAPMNYTGKRGSGWWYKGRYNGQELWTYSWAVAHSLQIYLLHNLRGLHAEAVTDPSQLELGDVISYDFDGNGRYQHSAIVTATDTHGMPLVNAHTNSCRKRYWSYMDSAAWTERTQYRFLHIIEVV
jgi:cell wall-associated NlpC family hydrolase